MFYSRTVLLLYEANAYIHFCPVKIISYTDIHIIHRNKMSITKRRAFIILMDDETYIQITRLKTE
jgi:hypothetical protein